MWIKTNKELPPENVVVETKIDNGMNDIPRNVKKLVRKGQLWFYPDMSMYVYYTPTHWLCV
jgi:hypothetical protein